MHALKLNPEKCLFTDLQTSLAIDLCLTEVKHHRFVCTELED